MPFSHVSASDGPAVPAARAGPLAAAEAGVNTRLAVTALQKVPAPAFCTVQVPPPSSVLRIEPDSAPMSRPTAQPCMVSANATPLSHSARPAACVTQVAPPSRVARMTPPTEPSASSHPTAQPCEGSTKVAAHRSAPVPDVCRVQVAPPSAVATMAPSVPTAQAWLASVHETLSRKSIVPDA